MLPESAPHRIPTTFRTAPFELCEACDITAGPRHALDIGGPDWIDNLHHHDWNGARRLRQWRNHTIAGRKQDVGCECDHLDCRFFRERWINADPAVVDRNAVALRPTQCSKGLLECRAARDCFDVTRGKLAHYDDAPLRAGSLRPRRDRPSRRATNQTEDRKSTRLNSSHSQISYAV